MRKFSTNLERTLSLLQDDSLPSLSSRLYELMRYEVCRRVNFGLFIGTASREQVAKAFVSSAKKCLRSVRDTCPS